MRKSLGAWVFVLGTACAHVPEKPTEPAAGPPASAEALLEQAEAAYEARSYTACARLYLQWEARCEDDDCRAESLYESASCAALAGQPDEALARVKQAVQRGYANANHLRLDPELASLHALPGWPEVLAGVQANLEKAEYPPLPVPVLAGVDTYGSRHVDAKAVRELLGFELGKPLVHSRALFQDKEAELRKRHGLAWAKVSMSYWLDSPTEARAYLTMDLVDAGDTARLRMLPEPRGTPEDPEGLVARWREYETKGFALMQQGVLIQEEGGGCRVAHCRYGFGHPELAPLEPVFLGRVPVLRDAVVKVLREDANANRRSDAAFLLAYAGSPEQVVASLVPSIRDPDSGVRNNVLRVLGTFQKVADRPLVDVAVVADALSMPSWSDRNKSLYLLQFLLEDLKPEGLKAQRASLIQRLGASLVELATSAHPQIHEASVAILERLSGETHAAPEQWKAWLSRQAP
ncbi:HEAT repeat domain-containing protein [Pyxidicoccus sp. 3LG]